MRSPVKIKKRWIVLLVIIGVLVLIRLLLPVIIVHYANENLKQFGDYTGHVDDIDLALIKGSYIINKLYVDKIDSATKKRLPFVKTDVIAVSLDWKSLFKGKIIGEMAFLNPIIFFSTENDPEDVQDDTTTFKSLLKNFMPIKINRLEVNNGQLKFTDSTVKPVVDISLDNIYILAQNLSSIEDTALLPASITLKADVYGGTLNVKMKMDPLAKNPTFDMNVQLDNTNLVELNDFFKAYAKIDVNKGTFGLYSEVAVKDKKFAGYVKPVIKDLDIVGQEDRDDNFLNKVWEAVSSFAGTILQNKEEDQVASKIPVSGNFNNPTVNIWFAILSVLRNAFVQAIYPSIDNAINIASVNKKEEEKDKSVFEKIFDGSDNEKKDKEKEKKKEEKKEKKKEEKEKEKEKENS